ncbi:hypothetical protein PHYPSEUDO_001820 [Phytophthora pseudosyringae]|uniref:Uncharacterized protein n=1 Tax=Phytophthora pseudosyringae TaxID=221518 RepID=A0A8T1V2M1_9STRA|nr:hypothetical protein PHYPSEUDO_001820 [Phytophthora pseudosyringae]
MMHWGKLDKTPWAKYVPSWYFKKAESYLETLVDPPSPWPALKKFRLDAEVEIYQALFDEVEDEVDDEKRDESYKDDSAGTPSKPVRSSSPPAKRSRPAQDRKKSFLARKEYSELTKDELWVIEKPGRGIMSWRHYGILVKFPPGTANALEQTTGFPDYIPNLSKETEITELRKRWKPTRFRVIWDAEPWDVMYDESSKFLLLHRRSKLPQVVRDGLGLDDIVAFMSDHRRAFWLIGHWFFIT